jgi:hypothetical protein
MPRNVIKSSDASGRVTIDDAYAAANIGRASWLIDNLIAELELDLSGLAVFTEAASGPYLWSPLIAARAGARAVYAVTRDSDFGAAGRIERDTMAAADVLGLAAPIKVVREKRQPEIADSDIITNSGFVRPIDAVSIGWMKQTAVIPLMWETWEFRADDLDLNACRQNGILVMGTNEHEPPCNMTGYSGMSAIKLLFDLGLEVYRSRVIVLGGQATLAEAIVRCLTSVGCGTEWFSAVPGKGRPYEQFRAHFLAHGARYDAIIVAEHAEHRCLLGRNGLMSIADLAQVNPQLRVGVMSGNVDADELAGSSLRHLPLRLRGPGYVSYPTGELGPRPVMDLYAAGLKVGEAMARARLKGLSLKHSAEEALQNSPAMDFEGAQAWL